MNAASFYFSFLAKLKDIPQLGEGGGEGGEEDWFETETLPLEKISHA